ncbi:MAG: WxL domain-containing protein [Actinomycetota bacterium]
MKNGVCIALALSSLTTWTITWASGQTLTISNVTVADFATVTLDGTAKSTTATIDGFTVNDTRLINDGWNVTVQATQFAEHNGTIYIPAGKTLPTGSLQMAQPTVAANGTLSPPPIITTGPYTIDGSSVKIASAIATTGVGRYDFTQGGALTLAIPASAFALRYRSDLTISVGAGP